MFSPCETDFNLDRHIISFLQDNPFFAELSRHIRKVPTRDLPTAGVAFDQQFDDLTLYWNPTFFGGGEETHIVVNTETGDVKEEIVTVPPMTDAEVRGVLLHEFYHLVFCHLSGRRKTPPKMWNVATDLAINSIITEGGKQGNKTTVSLPDGCLLPGVFPAPKGKKLTEEQKAAMPISALIASLPHDQSSEWYFEKLKDKADEKDLYTWRRGTKVEGKRVRGGGTDFNAPTRIANDPRNRGRWDGMLILTDGECERPGPSRVKRGWVVSSGHKLMFPTEEMAITLDSNPVKTGAWR